MGITNDVVSVINFEKLRFKVVGDDKLTKNENNETLV